MGSLETPPFVGHFPGLVGDYPNLVGRFDAFVGDSLLCWTLSRVGCRLREVRWTPPHSFDKPKKAAQNVYIERLRLFYSYKASGYLTLEKPLVSHPL